MPAPANRSKPSWADQVEEGENEVTGTSAALPTVSESHDKGLKTVVEYKTIEDKKVKIVRVYRVETHLVSKSIAERKTWKKFGDAARDPPGPNPSNTIVAEDVFMQFITNKEAIQEKEDPLKNAKNITCRLCNEDHWTVHCPYRGTLEPLQESLKSEEKNKAASGGGAASSAAADDKKPGSKYIPPGLREGGNRRGDSMQSSQREEYTIRVTNLSEEVMEKDLQELFKPFGTILRHYLAIDKATQQSKGFAFVTFTRKEDAAKAINAVSGYGYDHLILNVEWAKPPAQ